MITYRLLTAADSLSLYECFLVAFSDYQVDMHMSQEQFQQRLARDGVRMEMSAASFDEGRMIAFYINGIGDWHGKHTAYDAGTGVVPGYRKRGIARDLFAFMVPRLKQSSITQYLLEVLTSNDSAVKLYRKLGFVELRRLAVFRSNQRGKALSDLRGVSVRRVEKPDWALFKTFWDSRPSWQNSPEAVERVADQRIIFAAYVEDRCVGYAILFQPASNLMQLAVTQAHRRKGIGSAILAAVQREVSESLKVNNIDEEPKGTLAFYEASGFKVVLRQFEMIRTL